MTSRILILRELNRATLARQMLLARDSLPAPAAVEPDAKAYAVRFGE